LSTATADRTYDRPYSTLARNVASISPSETKRIVGVIAFVLFFAVLAIIRIFVMGSAMSRWGLVAATLMIAFELLLLRTANRALRSGEEIPRVIWNSSIILESIFPAVGISFLASSRLLPDYRPLATPWALAFFPLILLSVLRLSPRLCWIAGVFSTTGYLVAAFVTGWRFNGFDGWTVTETAVAYFAAVIVVTGALAAGVAAQIRTHVEAALHEAETEHQLKQVEHELQIARSNSAISVAEGPTANSRIRNSRLESTRR
jgi:hypothetical protein